MSELVRITLDRETGKYDEVIVREMPDGSIITYREPSTDVCLYYELYNKESVEDRKFYNIGAGGFRHLAWTNVDHESEWYKDSLGTDFIDWDLLSLTPLPVESDSAEIVYSSHLIEHITNDAARNLFNEAFRILKKNGIFRVTAPNIDLDYRAYKERDRHYFYWLEEPYSVQQLFRSHFATSASISDSELNEIFGKMEYEKALDYCISKCSVEEQKKHPGNHINWWNAKKLFRTLETAGFRNILLSSYGQSFSPVLRETMLFDNCHPKISFYMEATK